MSEDFAPERYNIPDNIIAIPGMRSLLETLDKALITMWLAEERFSAAAAEACQALLFARGMEGELMTDGDRVFYVKDGVLMERIYGEDKMSGIRYVDHEGRLSDAAGILHLFEFLAGADLCPDSDLEVLGDYSVSLNHN